MEDWSATQYLKFEDDRTRPPRDLVAQVPLQRPRLIVDLGCGPGNSTELLVERFPQSEIVGLDSSPDMLKKARQRLPQCSFIEADIATWQPDPRTDLIFGNAVMQWLPDHPAIMRRLLEGMPKGGVLAIQMPAMHDTPLRRAPYDIAASGPWAECLRGVTSAPGILSAAEYWDVLRPHVASLDMWQTTYIHALAGEDAVLEWASGSSLRPFLDRLTDEQKVAFGQAYAEAVRPHYPRRADGATLLPFQRLFMVARKG